MSLNCHLNKSYIILLSHIDFSLNIIKLRSKDLILPLSESGNEASPQDKWGEIYLTVTLIPKTQEEKDQVRHDFH